MKNKVTAYMRNKERGITLLYVILTLGFLVAISSTAISIAYQQSVLSSYNADALKVYYASESAAECGLYWDVKRGIFSPSYTGGNQVYCGEDMSTFDATTGFADIEFEYDNGIKATVRIDKRNQNKPTIRSYGYSGDPTTGQAEIQRGLNLSYSQNVDAQLPKNDIVLVLDVSGSITANYAGDNLIDLIRGATTTIESFVDDSGTTLIRQELGEDVIKVSLVTFGQSADLVESFSSDKSALISQIEGLIGLKGLNQVTNLAGGLIVSKNEISNNGRIDVDDTKYVVVITDGQANVCATQTGIYTSTCPVGLTAETQAWEEAGILKSQGVKIVGIGIGINSTYATKLRNNMVNSGSVYDPVSDGFVENTPMYFDASDFNALQGTLENVVKSILFDISQTGFVRQEL